MRCEFLPPYSPDFNPIELAFSYMKYHLRRNGEYVRMAMTEMTDVDIYVCLLKPLYTITPQDARGWYSYCGYIWVCRKNVISVSVLVHCDGIGEDFFIWINVLMEGHDDGFSCNMLPSSVVVHWMFSVSGQEGEKAGCLYVPWRARVARGCSRDL